MDEIIIVGAGGCGREVANWIEDINKVKESQLKFLANKVEEAYKEYLKKLEGGSNEN